MSIYTDAPEIEPFKGVADPEVPHPDPPWFEALFLAQTPEEVAAALALRNKPHRARVAYSEDQPRDAHGRFGEGTHTPAEDTEWKPLPSTTDVVLGLRAGNAGTAALEGHYRDTEAHAADIEQAASNQKDYISKDIGQRILADPEAAAALARYGAETIPPIGKGSGEFDPAAAYAVSIGMRSDPAIDDLTIGMGRLHAVLAEGLTVSTVTGMTHDEVRDGGRAELQTRVADAFNEALAAGGGTAIPGDPHAYDIVTSDGFKQAFADSLNGKYAADPPEKQAEAWASWVLGRWADSASDTGTSLALQQSVSDIFGVSPHELSTAVDGWLGSYRYLIPEGEPIPREDAWRQLTTGDGRTVMDATARSMYEATQEYLTGRGITSLYLSRGYNPVGSQTDVVLPNSRSGEGLTPTAFTVTMNPVSSWSTSETIASGFGVQTFEAAVPVERVFGTSLTGLGSLSEREVTVLGDPINVLATV